MKVGINIAGAGAVIAQLRYAAKAVPDNGRKVMSRSAEKIVKLAQLLVPEDTAALRDSIRIERTYGTNNRLSINVVAGNKIITLENGRTIDLNTYALIVHENYSQMKPGARTQEKQAANPGVQIGEGFLTRAAEMQVPQATKDMEQSIFKLINVIFQGETDR